LAIRWQEYITPAHLRTEVTNEIYAHNGPPLLFFVGWRQQPATAFTPSMPQVASM
jgi:hypothetical protein